MRADTIHTSRDLATHLIPTFRDLSYIITSVEILCFRVQEIQLLASMPYSSKSVIQIIPISFDPNYQQ